MKAHKYRAKAVTVDGIRFQSKLEAGRYGMLKLMEKAGQISELRLQVPYKLDCNGVSICKYVADFVYLDSQGRRVIEDAKGVLTAEFRIKAKLMAAHGWPVTIWPERTMKRGKKLQGSVIVNSKSTGRITFGADGSQSYDLVDGGK